MQIAETQLARAEEIRASMFAGDPESTRYEQELAASMVAVAAAAFAVEAEKGRTGLETKPAKGSNQGDRIATALVARGSFTQDEAARLGALFTLRNESVHPTHGWDEVMPWHPSGFTRTGAVYSAYALEQAREAVAIARLAIEAMA